MYIDRLHVSVYTHVLTLRMRNGKGINNGQTDRHTHRPSTVTLAAHARRGLISFPHQGQSENSQGPTPSFCKTPVHTTFILHILSVHSTSLYPRISTNHNSLGCKQPSRPRCRTITQRAGCVSANARPLQLRWGDQECGCFTPCTLL